jgi:Resolvase, N terminal domain
MCSSAFGYARIAAHASEHAVRAMRKDLAAHAEREGYMLTEVFMEREDSGSSAFAALIDAINRSEPPVVVVPSMCHFAHLPGLQIAMKDLIERETSARVLVIAPACSCDRQVAG